MSFFKKSKIELEKTLHHHFFGVRLRHFRDLTFMLLCGSHRIGHTHTIMLRIAYSRPRIQKMVAEVGKPFCAILGWHFSGDVLDNTPGIFSVRWSRIVPRGRIAQKMVAEVGKSFCAILG